MLSGTVERGMNGTVAPLTLRLVADPASLSTLRPSVRAWLEGLEIVEPDVAAIVPACWEVTADAAESAPMEGKAHRIHLTAALAGGEVVVRCTAQADWPVEDHASRYVAALLVDDVAIDRSPDAVSVLLRKAASCGLAP